MANSQPRPAQAERSRRGAYTLLVLLTAVIGAGSLALSAPAWWPGEAAGLPPAVLELAERTRSLRAQQSERLRQYAWRDRQAGVVAIPIERAMDLVAQEAAQGRAAATPPVDPRSKEDRP